MSRQLQGVQIPPDALVLSTILGLPPAKQAKVPVFEDDTVDELTARVHAQEHRIYPLVVKWFCQGRLGMANDKAVFDGETLPEAGYASED